jgi:polyvinyl alcohol dehydrogenase (cytochrome)
MTLVRTLIVTVALAALAGPAEAADWPVYGRDLANTRTTSDGPAPARATTLKQAWSFTDPDGDFTGTPVVAAGRLVAGSFAGHVYAFDADSGRRLWTADVGAPVNGSAAIDAAAGLALVPVQSVGSPKLVALSLADGSQRWSTVLTDQAQSSVYGSPAIWRGTAFIGTSGPNGDDSSARGTVVALDEQTGAVRWRTYTVPPDHDGGPVWSTPAIDAATGRLYVGTGNAYHGEAADTTDAILALDAATGAVLDHFTATHGDAFAADNPAGPDADFGASPNLIVTADGRRLVGEGDKTGTYWALDRETLDPVWSAKVGSSTAVGGVVGSTAYDGRSIYGPDTATGGIWSISDAGRQRWDSSDGGTLDFAPVTVANGVLYTMSSGGVLVARDARTGAVLTRFLLGGPSFGGISVVGDHVFAAVGTGPLFPPAPQQGTSGKIVAFAAAAGARAEPLLHLAVAPRRTRAGRRTRFVFRVRSDGTPVAGAAVRLAGHRARTGRRGRAVLRMRLRRGRHWARAAKPGLRADRVRISAR